jgi:hypothetical protein
MLGTIGERANEQVNLGYRKANSEMSRDGTELIYKATPAILEIQALLSNTIFETCKSTNRKQHG